MRRKKVERSGFAACLQPYVFLLAGLLSTAGPGSAARLTTRPIKWVDPDNRPVPKPKAVKEYQIWDVMDHMLFYPVGKLLDLGWTTRRLGNHLNLGSGKQADNINALDEVPNSSWYTSRHALRRMTPEELMRGPGYAHPDTSSSWEVIAGKSAGRTVGFTIRDAAGDIFLLKLESRGNEEMASSAEVIATKILHAAGYNVPQNSVVYFHPDNLNIGSGAEAPGPGGSRPPMTEADLRVLLEGTTRGPDGRIRCLASKFLEGEPVGVFRFYGRRRDDPNDRVSHEHRRELRGLRVISSWMNDADRRTANTLDMYMSNGGGQGYLKHHIIDMGSTFGSNNWMPHLPKWGNEYLWGPKKVGLSFFALGLYRPKWQVGLDPFRWVPYLLGERRSTMPPTRPPYPPEFKKQMVELVRAGRTPGELAKEFEPSDQTIRNWVVQADRDEGLREDGLTSDEREELRRLRREIKQLRIEREILSKAAAWFAQETNTIPRKPSSS